MCRLTRNSSCRTSRSAGAAGKRHMCEEFPGAGGTTVYVCGQYPNGPRVGEYRNLLNQNPKTAKWGCATMARDPVSMWC